MGEDNNDLKKCYNSIEPNLKEARNKLRQIIEEVINKIEDKKLVRAKLNNIRIKEFPKLLEKAKQKKLSVEEAINKLSDLVGAMIICNNIDDVYRFYELLKETLPLSDNKVTIQDYIKNPKDTGYRALHINFSLITGKSFFFEIIPCEIQIRSLLQDSWAELSHEDVYKEGDKLSDDLHDDFKNLANLLCAADNIAQKIRERISKEQVPKSKQPDLSKLTKDGLVYIFADIFGRYPSDYTIRETKNICKNIGVKSLNKLKKILKDEKFRDSINNSYNKVIASKLSNEDIFTLAPYAVSYDYKYAINKAKKRAVREKKESDRIWRKEILSELPENIEEFISEIKAGGINDLLLYQIAEVLGSTNSCSICGIELIDPQGFEEALYDYYGIDIMDGRVDSAISNLGIEITDYENPYLCSYHAHQLKKDD